MDHPCEQKEPCVARGRTSSLSFSDRPCIDHERVLPPQRSNRWFSLGSVSLEECVYDRDASFPLLPRPSRCILEAFESDKGSTSRSHTRDGVHPSHPAISVPLCPLFRWRIPSIGWVGRGHVHLCRPCAWLQIDKPPKDPGTLQVGGFPSSPSEKILPRIGKEGGASLEDELNPAASTREFHTSCSSFPSNVSRAKDTSARWIEPRVSAGNGWTIHENVADLKAFADSYVDAGPLVRYNAVEAAEFKGRIRRSRRGPGGADEAQGI
eukprot:scaffold396_cov352-Pavlova_lutheri.AAC.5